MTGGYNDQAFDGLMSYRRAVDEGMSATHTVTTDIDPFSFFGFLLDQLVNIIDGVAIASIPERIRSQRTISAPGHIGRNHIESGIRKPAGQFDQQ